MSEDHFKEYYKLPRIFTDFPLQEQGQVTLSQLHTHYLKNVMRRKIGDNIRVFNNKNGEFLTIIEKIGKKETLCSIKIQIRPPESQKKEVHLLFSPLKKHRMAIIIEKSVELGVTDLHPITTERADIRKINPDKIKAQIIESAEQCERMRIPNLHPLEALPNKLRKWNGPNIFWAAERLQNTTSLGETTANNWAFLIGPVGGFTKDESKNLQEQEIITPISLGSSILRAETACLLCLAHAQIKEL